MRSSWCKTWQKLPSWEFCRGCYRIRVGDWLVSGVGSSSAVRFRVCDHEAKCFGLSWPSSDSPNISQPVALLRWVLQPSCLYLKPFFDSRKGKASRLVHVKRTPAYLRNRGFHKDIPENSRSNYLSPCTINNECTRGQQTVFSKARDEVECEIHMGT